MVLGSTCMKYLKADSTPEYALILFIIAAFGVHVWLPQASLLLWTSVVLGALPTLTGALKSTAEKRISIDTFNVFAIAVSFAYGDVRSATFIILMLSFARILNTYTESRTRRTLEELLKLKPRSALREKNGVIEEIAADAIVAGDILLVHDGARIPVDGSVVFGTALVNESSVTGESVPVSKVVGDRVLSSTLNESGLIKIRATRVGKDSTIEQMAMLVKEAANNKSRSEKLADRFAAIYLPVVLALGIGTYLITRNISMTAALFLVACADDMAVAIPLAITAALGKAARRGVIIKGGEWIEALSAIRTLIIDKTGTLTYGTFTVKEARIEPTVSTDEFWTAVALTEKFSEHPVGRTIFKEALKHAKGPPDPDTFRVYKGSGVVARHGSDIIAIGDYSIIADADIAMNEQEKKRIRDAVEQDTMTRSFVVRNGALLGYISVDDIPRPQARQSVADLKHAGVNDIRMFTGDNEMTARRVAQAIGIDTMRSSMLPEEKLKELERIVKTTGSVAMVGDGVNDAAALARADVGIAMGSGGAAVAVEAADVVVLNDDLSRLPEMVLYSRKVMSVIRWDMVIWVVSNVLGFTLVLTGVIGPALAALYNFVSDFFPLINSARLFREKTPL